MKRSASAEAESFEEESCCFYQPKRNCWSAGTQLDVGQQRQAGCSTQRTSASSDADILLDHWRTQEAKLQPGSLWRLQHEVTPDRRCMLVSWLLDVAHGFKLSLETRLLAIDLMDRYLATTRLTLSDFRLLGITCLWVAAKWDEVHPPSARHLCAVASNLYTSSQMVDMERKVLSALGFEVGRPTPLSFFEHFQLEAGIQSAAVDGLARHLMELATLASCPHYTPKAAPALVASLPLLDRQPAAAKAPAPALAAQGSAKPELGRRDSDLSTNTEDHRTPECRAVSLMPTSPPSRASSCSSLTFNVPSLSPFPTPEPGPELTSAPPSALATLTSRSLATAAAAEEAMMAAAHQPGAFRCCNGCCLAGARPSLVAAAALNVALVFEKQQSPELLQRISGMAQCPLRHLLQLSQALLQLQMASANTPGCATLIRRFQGRRQVRARRAPRPEASYT